MVSLQNGALPRSARFRPARYRLRNAVARHCAISAAAPSPLGRTHVPHRHAIERGQVFEGHGRLSRGHTRWRRVCGTLAVLLPHASEWALLAVLALAVAPLAFIACLNPQLSAAPVTAIIVLLVPLITHATPLASALDRVYEVSVGA